MQHYCACSFFGLTLHLPEYQCWNPSVLQRVLDWQSHRASGSVCPEVDSLSLVKTQLRIVCLGGSSTSKVWLCIVEGRETVFLAPNHPCVVASVPPRESLLHQTICLHWQKDSPWQVDGLWSKTRQQEFTPSVRKANWVLQSDGYVLGAWLYLVWPRRSWAVEKADR